MDNEKTLNEEIKERMRKAPWWILSLTFHAGLVVLLACITIKNQRPDIGIVGPKPVVITDINPTEKPSEVVEIDNKIFEEEVVEVIEDVVEMPHETDVEADAATDVATNIDTAVDINVDIAVDTSTVGLNVSSVGMPGLAGDGDSDGMFDGLNGGENTPKVYVSRITLIDKAPPETLDTVQRSLAYLARIQEDNGSWNPGKHEGKNDASTRVAVSGLATLCFLGAGHSETSGKYRKQVTKALAWLRDQQNEKGFFNSNMYANGIANMAVAEGYGMAPHPRHRAAAQRGIDAMFSAMNPAGGWDYKAYSPGQATDAKWQATDGWRCDSSVAGWQLLAIKSAKMSGLNIPAGKMKLALDRVDKSTNGSTHLLGYTGPTGLNPRMAAVGLVVNHFFGKAKQRDKRAKSPADLLLDHLPDDVLGKAAKSNGYYHVYYSALAMFQQGGKWWLQWRDSMVSFLRSTQNIAGGDLDGSWDPEWGAGQHGAERLGRAGITAAYCLSMEVFWRYRRMR